MTITEDVNASTETIRMNKKGEKLAGYLHPGVLRRR
jgi:hypothetical protein